jgi:hypothetical protein
MPDHPNELEPGSGNWQGLASPLASASSFIPEEYLKLLSPGELAIVIDVVQQVLDGTLPKTAIAKVRGLSDALTDGLHPFSDQSKSDRWLALMASANQYAQREITSKSHHYHDGFSRLQTTQNLSRTNCGV